MKWEGQDEGQLNLEPGEYPLDLALSSGLGDSDVSRGLLWGQVCLSLDMWDSVLAVDALQFLPHLGGYSGRQPWACEVTSEISLGF